MNRRVSFREPHEEAVKRRDSNAQLYEHVNLQQSTEQPHAIKALGLLAKDDLKIDEPTKQRTNSCGYFITTTKLLLFPMHI